MSQIIKSSIKFSVVLFVMAIACALVWRMVSDRLYDCTDDNVLGFLRPGNWVHSWQGHPVQVVPQVIHGRSMSEPDTIKEGWNITKLWNLWFCFVAVSLLVSFFLAQRPWFSKRHVRAVCTNSIAMSDVPLLGSD